MTLAVGDVYEYVSRWKTRMIVLEDRGDNWVVQVYSLYRDGSGAHKLLQNKKELEKGLRKGKFKLVK